MASSTTIVSHEKITKQEFEKLLDRYASVVEAISQSKGAKDGQKTLAQLDQFRYVDALKLFGGEKPDREMTLDDVKLLVEWKLRHGKFRPTLMNLVSSNPPQFTSQTIQSAITTYHSNSTKSTATALETLTKLKGIGPATASLLLTVHDPANVIFFSDEAFYWLCCEGKKASIKYNNKEYLALRTEADKLAKRLGVSATEIEKAAYVLFKGSEPVKEAKDAGKVKGGKEAKKALSAAASGKRKAAQAQLDDLKKSAKKERLKDIKGVGETVGGLRRSTRQSKQLNG